MITAHSGVYLHIGAAMRDPAVYREPEAFQPERFMTDKGLETVANGFNPEYLPFGVGPRVCAGRKLAELEVNLAAARLIQCFTLAPAGGLDAVPVDETFSFTVHPKHPQMVTVTVNNKEMADLITSAAAIRDAKAGAGAGSS